MNPLERMVLPTSSNGVRFEETVVDKYKWNVKSPGEFKKDLITVFEKVSSAVKTTLGPYGSQVILDRFGETHITKDGWSILKKIRFEDDQMVLNSILDLVLRIAGPVVANVGDGSTSSIVLAYHLYDLVANDEILENLRPRDKKAVLDKICNAICSEIQKDAKYIDKDGDLNEVYKLAHVSTNGDSMVAEMIREIYKKTGNPTIQFKEAKGSETYYEITDGYKLKLSLVDAIYVNSDDNSCDVTKPMYLLFDHKVSDEVHWGAIQDAARHAISENTKLVVSAPFYSQTFMKKASVFIRNSFKDYGDCHVIFTVTSTNGNVLANEYSDFAMLTGSTLFTETDYEKRIELQEKLDEESKETNELSEELTRELRENSIVKFLGQSGKISINDKDATANDFYNKDTKLYETHMLVATAEYKELREKNLQHNIIDPHEYDLKQRIAKLQCNMGSIFVGGETSIERRANYDLVEDAVKACESAFTYGYNVGCNLAIMKHAERVEYSVVDGNIEERVCAIIASAATRTYLDVLNKKFEDDDKSIPICNQSYERYQVYDLVKDEFSSDIINSCRTDIEILKAATSIVSLLISSSLFVSLKP